MIRLILTVILGAAGVLAQDGAAVYAEHCAGCHDAPGARIQPLSALRTMSAAKIQQALETIVMRPGGDGLTSAERYAVIIYLAVPTPKAAAIPATGMCGGGASKKPAEAADWNGWGVNTANTRFQTAAAAGITAADVPKLKLKWAFGLGDATMAKAQPAVVGGRLLIGTESGAVYSLDARTGCIQWSYQAETMVVTAVVAGPSAAYFGDQKANEYAVDLTTGKLLWKVHVDDHFAARVSGAAQLHGGVLYVPVASYEEVLPLSPKYECCTFRGSVLALDAATGKRIWKTYTMADEAKPTQKTKAGVQMRGPSGASIWSAPTFDEKSNVLYVATGNNYSDPVTPTSDAVLALDAKSGKMLWSKQLTPNDASNSSCTLPGKANCPDSDGPDFDFGQPPILVALANGKRALVIAQKSGVAFALDPDKQGELLWQTRVSKGGMLGGSQWGSAADADRFYVAVSDLQIGGIAPDATSPQGFRLLLDANKGGGLFALRLSTGEKVWSAKPPVCGDRKVCSPAQSAAVSGIPGVIFSGAVDGHLRAYSAASGEVIWDVDTVRDYDTVNGQKAHGGSLDGGGPAIAGGMLYVNSGYAQWGGMPGNVLLAFAVDGK